MRNLNLKFRSKCTWWICTLVALIPIAMLIWVAYMMFFDDLFK